MDTDRSKFAGAVRAKSIVELLECLGLGAIG
jgi:hypothetical protein